MRIPVQATTTFKCASGDLVLGKLIDGTVTPKIFANRSLANNAATRIPGAAVIQRGRPFLVRVPVAQ